VSQGELFDRERPHWKRRAYHVRAHQTVGETQAGERRAATQDQIILDYFRNNRDVRVTPWQLVGALGGKMLLTSIRRSLTNLTQKGLLRRHDEDRRPGEAGALNATWSLP
jgi:hypothetical protein